MTSRYLTFWFDKPVSCEDVEHVTDPDHVCIRSPFGGDYETPQQADDCVGSDLYHLFDTHTGDLYEPGAWPLESTP